MLRAERETESDSFSPFPFSLILFLPPSSPPPKPTLQLNYCEEETNNKTGKPAFACSISSCSLPASPNSDACKQVHGNANTVTRRYKLVATWGKAAPDGKEVDVVLINGLYPAPTIFSNAGDRLIVEFVNQLEGPTTSIHWHGINQVRKRFLFFFFFAADHCRLFFFVPLRSLSANKSFLLFFLFNLFPLPPTPFAITDRDQHPGRRRGRHSDRDPGLPHRRR